MDKNIIISVKIFWSEKSQKDPLGAHINLDGIDVHS